MTSPRPRHVWPHHRGYTILEVLMSIAIVAMLAVLVIPMAADEDRLRVDAAATVLVSDIELAQVMTVAAPKDPVVVRFDPANDTYWLAREATPEQPIHRLGTEQPYVVVLGAGRASTAAGVDLYTEDMTDDMLRFDMHGGLAELGVNPVIHLRSTANPGPYDLRIQIAPTTGSISVGR